MDDLARMRADLGLDRRDALSAMMCDTKESSEREHFKAQAAVRADFEGRQARLATAPTGGEGGRASRLLAWNTQGEFERDARADQLENRWSGQGHRIHQPRVHDDQYEAGEALLGEERMIYLKERNAGYQNYVPASPASSKQDRFRDHILGSSASTPRTVSGGRRTPRPGRTATVSDHSEHTRAASPRRFGTVRFGPGGRRVGDAKTTAPAMENPGIAAAKRLLARAMQQNNTKTATTSVPPPATSFKAPGTPASVTPASVTPASVTPASVTPASVTPAPTMPSAVVSTPSTTSTPNQALQETQTVVTSMPPAATHPPAPLAPTSTKTNGPKSTAKAAQQISKHDDTSVQVYFNHALWYAANPDKGCDQYYKNYPDRLQYLGRARDKLIMEATNLAKGGHEGNTTVYLQVHPERSWMVDAAKKAKEQVEQGVSDEEIEEYCVTHPRHMVFVKAARAAFKPKVQENGTKAVNGVSSSDVKAPVASHKTSLEQLWNAPPINMNGTPAKSSSIRSDSAVRLPSSSKKGSLAATFFNATGQLLGSHCIAIDAPVCTEIKVTAHASGFDPLTLIGSIEALSQSMRDRSNGLEGVSLADDGLWEDDEL